MQWNAEHFSWYSNHRRDEILAYNKANGDAMEKEGKDGQVVDLDAGARLLNVVVVSLPGI